MRSRTLTHTHLHTRVRVVKREQGSRGLKCEAFRIGFGRGADIFPRCFGFKTIVSGVFESYFNVTASRGSKSTPTGARRYRSREGPTP